jgi:hypothetical protein
MMGELEDKMTGGQENMRCEMKGKRMRRNGERGGGAVEGGKSYVILVITIMSININFHM